MAKQQKPKPKPHKPELKTVENVKQELNDDDVDDFDFGGLPKDVPFKRNIGCGG